MAFINYATKNIAVKVVYYGPGLSGKTTNLRYIYSHIDTGSRGELICLETPTERTFFFDLLPIKAGLVEGFRTHFQLLTVPGQVFYEASRKSVIKGADGVVFVADSQVALLDTVLESYEGLKRNLAGIGLDLETIPFVLQYNKRDLDHLIPVETFNRLLNPKGYPAIEAVAVKGIGVFETLREIAKLTIPLVKRQLAADRVPRGGATSGGGKTPTVDFSRADGDAEFRLRKLKFQTLKDVEMEMEKLVREFSG